MTDIDIAKFAALSPTDYADGLPRKQFMDYGIKGLWPNMPRLTGLAYTVQLPAGDNLMLHKAIYDAPKGSVIVVNAGAEEFAVAGGNVCAIAQRNGVAGFVIDGVIRDIAEIREMQFPVFARGVIPVPGIKREIMPLNPPVNCGGAIVRTGDIIVADEEGIAAIPVEQAEEVYVKAKKRADSDGGMTLDEWQAKHHKGVMKFFE